ncbi:cell division protein FtsA [Virgibacillus sp. MSP4-1]|uniref:cell division protein FtsA n=1 Tax=Virgibacillus sp. MSP4-1 TaxID=2700081 RepID=UPI0003A11D37|nr:cell division protein FtsA [Virgibacillus sp. MSP4-1]QHS23049.1 cell division protein FtsA [Virgibacillus sp. MSP4-1]
MGEKIFAFDIGTRSVVGMILEKEENNFEVIDIVTEEHQKRSMLDGQIHDIVAVSNVINSVKEKLEEKHGIIKKVCVAAAGRALKTQQTEIETDLRQNPILTKNDVSRLELSAVQQAQYELSEQGEETTHYYCVGYSVLYYQLDGDEIGSLIDQQGATAKVKIIATFLPEVVVESLISALQRANLEMDALTLEPIAAINVLIPPSMRRLNVALVDVGAGTSDIAITNHGTVTGYGMVPIAGDEITDAISQAYLLDFPQAEDVKRELTEHQKAVAEDILGMETEIHHKDLVEQISDTINHLAKSICEEIFTLNHKSPQAVMLVGGGSLTPELTSRIAHHLKLPENRVAVRGTEAIQSLRKERNLIKGPSFVTPIGIAIAARQSPIQYVSVKVNERNVRLFDLKELTVGDCLLAAGIRVNKIHGKPGMALMVKVNGRQLSIPGTLGEPPLIKRNHEHVDVNSPIKHGDELTVEAGNDGKSPEISIKELTEGYSTQNISFQNQPYKIHPEMILNGKKADPDYIVNDGDIIDIQRIETLGEFLKSIHQMEYTDKNTPFTVYINGQLHITDEQVCTLFINGQKANPTSTLHDGDDVSIELTEELPLKELLRKLDLTMHEEIPIIFDSKPILLQKKKREFFKDAEKLQDSSMVTAGDHLTMKEFTPEPFIFQDIFRYIDIDVTNVKGKQFKLYINDQEASFTDQLSPHDEVRIQWIESYTKR